MTKQMESAQEIMGKVIEPLVKLAREIEPEEVDVIMENYCMGMLLEGNVVSQLYEIIAEHNDHKEAAEAVEKFRREEPEHDYLSDQEVKFMLGY